ncbi:hypothetical protein CYMTET_32707, partial [Cymbomonas tetramitiformis]
SAEIRAPASCVADNVACIPSQLGALCAYLLCEMQVEAVEIDPTVVFAAEAYLGAPIQRVEGESEGWRMEESAAADLDQSGKSIEYRGVATTLGDAAAFVKSRAGIGAGCVFLDAYDGCGKVPPHLEKDEFLESCASALRPGGILVVNLFNGVPGSPERQELAKFARKLERIIGPTYSVKVEEQQTNVILVATSSTADRDASK